MKHAAPVAHPNPVRRDNPQGLRWDVQLFSGCGETLLDDNHRQTGLGLGVSPFNFQAAAATQVPMSCAAVSACGVTSTWSMRVLSTSMTSKR